MEYVVQIGLTLAVCWFCYKMGQKKAWDYIAENYIAIHKKCVIGRILVQRDSIKKENNRYEKRNKKNFARRNDKKTSR
jgi:hypothetical protein